MLNENQAPLLEESLVTMHDKLSATIQVLSSSRAGDEQYWGAVTIWATDIHRVAEQAQRESRSALSTICYEIENQLNNLLNASPDFIENYCLQLIEWTECALSYVRNSDDLTLIDELLLMVPPEAREHILADFRADYEQGLQADPVNEDIPAPEPDDDLHFESELDPEPESSQGSTPQSDKIIEDSQAIPDADPLSEKLQSLATVIESAMDNILEELAQASLPEGKRSESLFDYCLGAVGDIGYAAELTEHEFIINLCGEKEQHLIALAGDSSALSESDTEQCFQWLTNLRTYLSNDNDPGLLAQLVEFIDEEQRAEITALCMSQAIDDEHAPAIVESFPAVTADSDFTDGLEESDPLSGLDEDDFELSAVDGQSDSDEVSANAILLMLREELSDLTEEMAGLINNVLDESADVGAQLQASDNYQALIERLADTCESLGLLGLQQVCSFVRQNLSRLTGLLSDSATLEQQQRESLRHLFMLWPEQALLYLEKPEDDHQCLELVDCLQNKGWLEPLSDTGARQLLTDLSESMTLPDMSDEQETSRETSARPEDVVTEIADTIMPELVDAFFHESPKVAGDLSHCIGEIGAGVDLEENISAAQRYAHTLKGSANLIGVKGIANLTHHMEDILEYLLTHQNEFPQSLVATLLEAADCVETLLDFLQGKDAFPEEAQRILQDVLNWANAMDTGRLSEFAASFSASVPVPRQAEQGKAVARSENKAGELDSSHALSEEFLNVPTRVVDNMFRMAGELSIMASQVRTGLEKLRLHEKEIKNQERLVQQHRVELEDMVDVRRFSMSQRQARARAATTDDFDSLEMDQYDELHGSIHGFIETVVDSTEMTHMIYKKIDSLENLLVSQQRLHEELQSVVMHARMVPVSTISARLQRTVRQTCRSTGKNVELTIIGEDLLLDSELLNTLVAPVMHVLRNAVDHGIETVADRDAAGKNPVGSVELEFARSGNNIVIHCRDDGKGLNYDRIREIAIQNNMISENDSLGNEELARLILLSGFTTREKVTQISGRGVGLGVVNTTIQSQGGSMSVSDNSPCGCVVSLNTPISLVTSHSILVKHRNEIVAIPSNTLERIVPPGVGEYRSLSGKVRFHDHNKVYDLVSLSRLLGIGSANSEQPYDNPAVLLTQVNQEIMAVAVEEVLSSDELVVKGLGRYVPPLPGISGVSIMGNGNVVPVLDLQELIEEPQAIVMSYEDDEYGVDLNETPTVLVVDDSLSMRKSLSQLVADAGFQVETARDGVEAMTMIRNNPPSLVLSDMEMPRMTGLELTSQIRSHVEFGDLPVVMITSRSTKKHRAQAERAGVNEYITKPFSEDALVDVVTSMIVGSQAEAELNTA